MWRVLLNNYCYQKQAGIVHVCRRAVFFYNMELPCSLQLHLWQMPVRSAVPLDNSSILDLELQETNFAVSNHCLCSLHSV